ncbi:hypothetical protein TWF106_002928 [Orbilia oligospora]|uniref:RNase H type-1 domain-containing protein n=1 Tax=Orbilia oligospora TaxID=2813651 RepID=A0A7C8V718_ORBOL|nr:hypothetical protein TWF106_002928 [Orbilia oligospora]KAF3226426.1 hypothetical protein TWF191_004688 [Orbilia oligospora]
MASPRGLFINEDELDRMDVTVVSVPFTGYLPTGNPIGFRCVKQLPMPMLDIGFFKKNLLGKKSVSWTANWTLSFPGWRSETGACIFPMVKDRSYHKDDGEAFLFPSRLGQDIRIHAFGIVVLPIVVYGVPLSLQCLLVDKMYLIPLPRNVHDVPLLLDNRLFDGGKLPLGLTIFKPAFVMKPGTTDMCMYHHTSSEVLNSAICISISSACLEYGKHFDDETGEELNLEEDYLFLYHNGERRRYDYFGEPIKPKLYEELIGQNHCGAGIFFATDSQFNVSKRLDDEINTPKRAELQTAIEAMKSLANLIKYTGYTYRGAVVITNSRYVCQATEDPKTVFGWAMKGWKTDDGEDIPNSDLWGEFIKNLDHKHTITWRFCEMDRSAPAVGLARKAAMDNIFLNEGSDHDRRERERSLPRKFIEVEDHRAGPLYDIFVDTEAEKTTKRFDKVIFDGDVEHRGLPKGFYSMVDCRHCRQFHEYSTADCQNLAHSSQQMNRNGI